MYPAIMSQAADLHLSTLFCYATRFCKKHTRSSKIASNGGDGGLEGIEHELAEIVGLAPLKLSTPEAEGVNWDYPEPARVIEWRRERDIEAAAEFRRAMARHMRVHVCASCAQYREASKVSTNTPVKDTRFTSASMRQ
jgi:hypothetical protein